MKAVLWLEASEESWVPCEEADEKARALDRDAEGSKGLSVTRGESNCWELAGSTGEAEEAWSAPEVGMREAAEAGPTVTVEAGLEESLVPSLTVDTAEPVW